MVIVLVKPKIPENNAAFCSASKSNKQNARTSALDSPFFFHSKDVNSLKTTFCLHKARVCPTGFWQLLRPCSLLIYWLREFLLSAVANRFEFRCQLNQLLLKCYKICPCCSVIVFLIYLVAFRII